MIIATTTPNTLTSATMTQASNVTNTATTYTFSFVNTNIVPAGAKIEVIIPVGCSINTSFTCASVSGIDGGISCAKDGGNSLGIIISNGFSA